MAAITCLGANPTHCINHNFISQNLPDTITLYGNGVSLFYVVEANDQKDENLWWFDADSVNTFRATTLRTSIPEQGRYINYSLSQRGIPTLGSFRYSGKGVKTFGINRHKSDQFPINELKGILAECLVYDKPVSNKEKKQIESYLAIKYGITLDQSAGPMHYYASSGKIIWNGNVHQSYNQHLAGIGRDDGYGLYQTISGSTAIPGLMEVSSTNLSNGEYYVWGDNGSELRFRKKRGWPSCLGREWMAALAAKSMQVSFHLNTHYLDALPNAEETLYLVIDTSGTGLYKATDTHFYQGVRDSIWHFQNIVLLSEKSIYSHFSFISAPNFFAWLELDSPSCNGKQGSVTLKIMGGNSPYQIVLDGKKFKTNENLFTIPSVLQGNHNITITDTNENIYTTSFLMSTAGFDSIPSWDPVVLRKGFVQEVDATVDIPDYSYQWCLPDGEAINSGAVVLEQDGLYQLTVCDGKGCSTMREIEVSLYENSLINSFIAYPNPTLDGYVSALLQLERTASATVYLTDINGRVWDRFTCSGRSLYSLPCRLPSRGRWLLTAVVQGESKTLILIY